MPEISDIIKDPEFYKYSQETQSKILDRVDPDYKALSNEAKLRVLSDLTVKSKIKLPEAPKEAGESIPREIARTGGGIIGGLVAMTGGPTSWWTTPVGVGLGAAAGEAVYQLGQHVFEDPNAPKSPMEAAKSMGWAGIREGGLELGGGLAARGVMKVLSPFAKKVVPGLADAETILSGKIKPVLLPSEATESKALDILQNISEGSVLGGENIQKYRIARSKLFEDIADDLITQFGQKRSPDELGELFVEAIENKQKLHKTVANLYYQNIEGLASGAKISTKSLKTFAKPIAETSKELGGIEAKNAGDDLVADILNLPDEISFNAAKELRSRLISRVDEFNVINKKAPAIGKAKKFIELVHGEIEKGLSPDALITWQAANEFYARGQEKFNNVFIRRLLKTAEDTGQGPQVIGQMLVKPNAVRNIQKIKSALNPQEFELFQSFTIQDLFRKSLDSKTHVIHGGKLLNNMFYKPTGLGEKTLSEIFSPNQLDEIKRFAKTLEITQSKQGEGLGKMYIQLAQGAAAASILSAGISLDSDLMKGSAGIILFGPALLSRMMTKPLIVRMLTKGIQLPARSPEVIGLTARLISATRHIRLEESFGKD